MKRIYILTIVFACLASCVKPEIEGCADVEKVADKQKIMLKSLLAERDTKWTLDDLSVPQQSDGWIKIFTDKELAFLLEFGSAAGEKYRLMNDLDLSQSSIADLLSSEVGVEKFENFEFDGNGKTISGLELPWAGGLFSRVNNAKIYDLTLSGCAVGSDSNVSNLLGTGSLIGLAAGDVTVSGVTVNACKVSAPCKVGGFVGAVTDATCIFTNCNVIDTEVKTLYLKGISGWCGGFVGFVGRKVENSTEAEVSVIAENCSVSGGSVKAYMESSTRYSGTFLGTLNGYDDNEVFDMKNCQVSTSFVGLDSKASSYVSIYPDRKVGGNKYMNGYVCFDGLNYVTPWDGTTKTKPKLVNGIYQVYTGEELAWFQDQEVTDKIQICNDIDLGGHLFLPLKKASYIDGQKSEDQNYEIRNLKVVRTNCGKEDGGAFIRQASGTTVHKNITFRGADIKATHDESADHGNAYCATLCGNMTGTYTMENVHAYDGKLYGVNKMGGLLGRVYATATIKDCSVSGYTIENYKVMDKPETFTGTAEKAGMTVTATATFYPHGEIGGMIGFVQGKSEISNCQISNTAINATGQADVQATLSGSPLAVGGINLLGGFIVPGRHVSALIGDIRTGKSGAGFAVTISNCTVGSDVNVTPTWDKHSSNAPFIGQCYYVYSVDNSSGSVTVDGNSQSIKHCVSF